MVEHVDRADFVYDEGIGAIRNFERLAPVEEARRGEWVRIIRMGDEEEDDEDEDKDEEEEEEGL